MFMRKQKQLVVHGIHDYLYAFFGSSSIDYEVKSKHGLPPSLKNIKRTCIEVPGNTTAEKLEACFVTSPNQEYIQLNGDFNGSLCSNSAILGAEHLRICVNEGHGDEILLRFRGNRLQFDSTEFHDSTISQFLKEWKSNQGFQNLKSLSIGSNWRSNYNAPKLLKDIDVKQLDQAEDILHISWQMSCSYYRPERFFSELPSKSRKVGFLFRDYLIRDGDGVEASVSIENHFVSFAVWKGNSCEVKNIND
ncbi:hypothetical protein GCK72_016615 [Caenorhabditis remanei]|uniref:F-box associated domain-containing protein n=1 Tax=Caenorhabditis remanei TaxID=31234 RepID=A0A6A5G6E7_CAERE|nr:hypothetical protein GCK72_016615 [Caenorhabditis remanei]KAF1750069.1 hypothetical protein GCK72_016615 [Caenorhabditis remanei]